MTMGGDSEQNATNAYELN